MLRLKNENTINLIYKLTQKKGEEMTLYVGIDISKDKFDASFTTDGEMFGHESVTNNKSGFKHLLKLVKKHQKNLKETQIHFCMEATGIYHFGLFEFLHEHSALVSVVNPLRTKSFSKSLMLRNKNDKVDSRMLAQYALIHKPPLTPKIPENIKKLRSLVRYRETLIESRTQELTRIKSTLDKEIQRFIGKKIAFIKNQIEDITSKIHILIEEDEFLTKQVNLLKTIDRIGDKVAWKMLAEFRFEALEDINPKSQVAHVGLSPREFSSGSSVRGRTHITKMGNSAMRKVLYLPALGCLKSETHFTPFYHRLIQNGKSHRQAQVAVMRKMVLVAAAVLKNQTPFDPDWARKTQEKYQEKFKTA